MKSEKSDGTLRFECKYCGGELQSIDPLTLVEADSETLAVLKTHVCVNCGASVTNRNSPASGDCLLEVPTEYKFALQKFFERLRLIHDDEDMYEYTFFDSLQCILGESNNQFGDIESHNLHGDSWLLCLCTCTQIRIHFDGLASFRISEERENFWEPERESRYSEQLESFSDLRHKLDELLFDSTQLEEVQDLLSGFLAYSKHPDFCSGAGQFSRLTEWRLIGSAAYPERYKLPGTSELEN